jgi:hypothetical protein
MLLGFWGIALSRLNILVAVVCENTVQSLSPQQLNQTLLERKAQWEEKVILGRSHHRRIHRLSLKRQMAHVPLTSTPATVEMELLAQVRLPLARLELGNRGDWGEMQLHKVL